MESASPNASDKEELVTQDILEGAIHGNDWRTPVSYTHLTLPTTPYV